MVTIIKMKRENISLGNISVKCNYCEANKFHRIKTLNLGKESF